MSAQWTRMRPNQLFTGGDIQVARRHEHERFHVLVTSTDRFGCRRRAVRSVRYSELEDPEDAWSVLMLEALDEQFQAVNPELPVPVSWTWQVKALRNPVLFRLACRVRASTTVHALKRIARAHRARRGE